MERFFRPRLPEAKHPSRRSPRITCLVRRINWPIPLQRSPRPVVRRLPPSVFRRFGRTMQIRQDDGGTLMENLRGDRLSCGTCADIQRETGMGRSLCRRLPRRLLHRRAHHLGQTPSPVGAQVRRHPDRAAHVRLPGPGELALRQLRDLR